VVNIGARIYGQCVRLLQLHLDFLSLPLLAQERSNSTGLQPYPWLNPLQHMSFLSSAGPSAERPGGVVLVALVWVRKPRVRIDPSEGKSSERHEDFGLLSVRLPEEERDRPEPDAELSASRTASGQRTMVIDQS